MSVPVPGPGAPGAPTPTPTPTPATGQITLRRGRVNVVVLNPTTKMARVKIDKEYFNVSLDKLNTSSSMEDVAEHVVLLIDELLQGEACDAAVTSTPQQGIFDPTNTAKIVLTGTSPPPSGSSSSTAPRPVLVTDFQRIEITDTSNSTKAGSLSCATSKVIAVFGGVSAPPAVGAGGPPSAAPAPAPAAPPPAPAATGGGTPAPPPSSAAAPAPTPAGGAVAGPAPAPGSRPVGITPAPAAAPAPARPVAPGYLAQGLDDLEVHMAKEKLVAAAAPAPAPALPPAPTSLMQTSSPTPVPQQGQVGAAPSLQSYSSGESAAPAPRDPSLEGLTDAAAQSEASPPAPPVPDRAAASLPPPSSAAATAPTPAWGAVAGPAPAQGSGRIGITSASALDPVSPPGSAAALPPAAPAPVAAAAATVNPLAAVPAPTSLKQTSSATPVPPQQGQGGAAPSLQSYSSGESAAPAPRDLSLGGLTDAAARSEASPPAPPPSSAAASVPTPGAGGEEAPTQQQPAAPASAEAPVPAEPPPASTAKPRLDLFNRNISAKSLTHGRAGTYGSLFGPELPNEPSLGSTSVNDRLLQVPPPSSGGAPPTTQQQSSAAGGLQTPVPAPPAATAPWPGTTLPAPAAPASAAAPEASQTEQKPAAPVPGPVPSSAAALTSPQQVQRVSARVSIVEQAPPPLPSSEAAPIPSAVHPQAPAPAASAVPVPPETPPATHSIGAPTPSSAAAASSTSQETHPPGAPAASSSAEEALPQKANLESSESNTARLAHPEMRSVAGVPTSGKPRADSNFTFAVGAGGPPSAAPAPAAPPPSLAAATAPTPAWGAGPAPAQGSGRIGITSASALDPLPPPRSAAAPPPKLPTVGLAGTTSLAESFVQERSTRKGGLFNKNELQENTSDETPQPTKLQTIAQTRQTPRRITSPPNDTEIVVAGMGKDPLTQVTAPSLLPSSDQEHLQAPGTLQPPSSATVSPEAMGTAGLISAAQSPKPPSGADLPPSVDSTAPDQTSQNPELGTSEGIIPNTSALGRAAAEQLGQLEAVPKPEERFSSADVSQPGLPASTPDISTARARSTSISSEFQGSTSAEIRSSLTREEILTEIKDKLDGITPEFSELDRFQLSRLQDLSGLSPDSNIKDSAGIPRQDELATKIDILKNIIKLLIPYSSKLHDNESTYNRIIDKALGRAIFECAKYDNEGLLGYLKAIPFIRTSGEVDTEYTNKLHAISTALNKLPIQDVSNLIPMPILQNIREILEFITPVFSEEETALLTQLPGSITKDITRIPAGNPIQEKISELKRIIEKLYPNSETRDHRKSEYKKEIERVLEGSIMAHLDNGQEGLLEYLSSPFLINPQTGLPSGETSLESIQRALRQLSDEAVEALTVSQKIPNEDSRSGAVILAELEAQLQKEVLPPSAINQLLSGPWGEEITAEAESAELAAPAAPVDPLPPQNPTPPTGTGSSLSVTSLPPPSPENASARRASLLSTASGEPEVPPTAASGAGEPRGQDDLVLNQLDAINKEILELPDPRTQTVEAPLPASDSTASEAVSAQPVMTKQDLAKVIKILGSHLSPVKILTQIGNTPLNIKEINNIIKKLKTLKDYPSLGLRVVANLKRLMVLKNVQEEHLNMSELCTKELMNIEKKVKKLVSNTLTTDLDKTNKTQRIKDLINVLNPETSILKDESRILRIQQLTRDALTYLERNEDEKLNKLLGSIAREENMKLPILERYQALGLITASLIERGALG